MKKKDDQKSSHKARDEKKGKGMLCLKIIQNYSHL